MCELKEIKYELWEGNTMLADNMGLDIMKILVSALLNEWYNAAVLELKIRRKQEKDCDYDYDPNISYLKQLVREDKNT